MADTSGSIAVITPNEAFKLMQDSFGLMLVGRSTTAGWRFDGLPWKQT